MSLRNDLNSIDHLVAELPYDLDDTDRAGADFERWMQAGDSTAKRHVDLWTYCYVRRFFLVKFMRERNLPDAELEPVVEKAYRNVERGRDQIREPSRYARWVTVVSRRTYLSYVTRRRDVVPVDRVAEPAMDAPAAGDLHDSTLVLAALLAAISRLPVFLREVARMKFVFDLSSEEMGRRLDKSPPTVRAYVHKVLVRFRADKRFHRAIGYPGYVLSDSGSEGRGGRSSQNEDQQP